MVTDGLRGLDWKLFAVAGQLCLAGGCAWLGWQVVHPAAAAATPKVQHAQAAPAPVTAALPLPLPVLPAPVVTGGSRGSGIDGLVQRVNRDDARLYRGQWQVIQVLGGATRAYLQKRIEPLLLAAARGGRR